MADPTLEFIDEFTGDILETMVPFTGVLDKDSDEHDHMYTYVHNWLREYFDEPVDYSGAPELLEALQVVVNGMDWQDEDAKSEECDPLARVALLAIARATGK